MFRLLLFAVIFTYSTITIFPQWTNQNPVPDGNNLWSTFFINDNTGWIVGFAGIIYKTTDSGASWKQQNSRTLYTLLSVYFADSQTGWAVGELGVILRTTNGGTNWSGQMSEPQCTLGCVYFYDNQIGWAVGYKNVILKTTDGGTNWMTLHFEE